MDEPAWVVNNITIKPEYRQDLIIFLMKLLKNAKAIRIVTPNRYETFPMEPEFLDRLGIKTVVRDDTFPSGDSVITLSFMRTIGELMEEK